MCTHYDGPAGGLAVHVLVAQVEDQCGSAIKESKHPNTHKELCRGGEVALQVGVIGRAAIAKRYLVRVIRQPEGRKTGRRHFKQWLLCFYSLVV